MLKVGEINLLSTIASFTALAVSLFALGQGHSQGKLVERLLSSVTSTVERQDDRVDRLISAVTGSGQPPRRGRQGG